MMDTNQRRLALSDELNQMANRIGSLARRVGDVGDPGGAMDLAQTVAALRNIADGLEYGEDGNLIRTEVGP